ncbi:hypothetical protein DENSPDRAFT_842714 [Dentipellis sp. KUC8613]|nr:hypothetical protein DENSPDRAFT_842714 [Dentipellis sp. KUC8613]
MNSALQPPTDAVLSDLEYMLQDAMRSQADPESGASRASLDNWNGHSYFSRNNAGNSRAGNAVPQIERPICPKIKLSYKYEKLAVQVPNGYTQLALNEPMIDIGGMCIASLDCWKWAKNMADTPFMHIQQSAFIQLYIGWPGYRPLFIPIPLRIPYRAGELTRGAFVLEAVVHIRMILDNYTNMPQLQIGRGFDRVKLAKGDAEGLQKEDIFLCTLLPVQGGQHGVIWVPEFAIRDVVFGLV